MKHCRHMAARFGAVAMIMILAVSGCGKKAEKKNAAQEAVPVKVARLAQRDLSIVLEYVGNVKAYDEATAYPKVTGKVIQKVKQDGDQVEKGDVIAYIDRDEVGLMFEQAPVESPLRGIVGRVYVDKGMSVTPQTPIALIVAMDSAKVDLDIPEVYLPKVYVGQDALITVDAYPDKKFPGKITKISPVVSLDNRAAPVEIVADNADHLLKPGMFAKVTLTIETHKNVLAILKESVIGRDTETYVYVVENNNAVLKKVSLGLRQEAYYEVLGGLKKGDLVVIVGQQRLRENTPVTVEMENAGSKSDTTA